MPCLFDLDFASDDALFSQDTLESILPPPPSAGGFIPAFLETSLDTPSMRPSEQNTLPSLPATPGASVIRPQTTTTPTDNGTRNWDPCYEETAGAELWLSGSGYSSVTVPHIPLVRPVQPYPQKSSHLRITQPTLSLPSTTAFPANWFKIPQRSYDHGRKQWSFKPLEPIPFSTNGRPGINLGNALRKIYTGLDGQDDPMLQNAAGVISCRLLVSFSRRFFPQFSRVDPIRSFLGTQIMVVHVR